MDYHSIFLFHGLTEADIDQMERSRCLRRKAFARRQTIFRTGDTVHEIGIVLRGAVHIESIDLWGSKSILSEVGEGQAEAVSEMLMSAGFSRTATRKDTQGIDRVVIGKM